MKTESLRQDRFHHFTIKSGKFENYVAGDAIHALSFKLQACIANTYLIFGDHEEVNKRTAAALACTHASRVCPCPLEGHCSHLYRGYGHDWEEDQKLDYVKLHYCKALALKHVGDTLRATEHMAKALGFDLENSTVSKQLTLLKQELEEDEARHRKAVRDDRLRKIKAPQVQLRKKQAKRKEKARA